MSYASIEPGKSFTSRGQRFDCVGSFDYVRPETWVRVFELRTVCPDCGRKFECTTTKINGKTIQCRVAVNDVEPLAAHIGWRAKTRKHGRGFEREVRKSDALKLKPGQRVRFGDSMWSRDCDHNWHEGTVSWVTANGGIRVRTKIGLKWIPYSHVLKALQDDETTM